MAIGRLSTLALAGWCSLIAGGPARADTRVDEAAVRQVVDHYFAAYAGKDLEAFMALWSAKSPDLAGRRQTMKDIFGETGPIRIKDLTVTTPQVKGDVATVRVRVEIVGNDARGKPYSQFGRLNRLFEMAREADGWMIRRYYPAERDLAVRLGGAKTPEERQRLLAGDKDLVGPDLVIALTGFGKEAAPRDEAEGRRWLKLAEDVADGTGDPRAQAESQISWGHCEEMWGHPAESFVHAQRAVDLFGRAKDSLSEAKARFNVGTALYRLDRYSEAVEWLTTSLTRFRDLHFRLGEAMALQNIGAALETAGKFADARTNYEAALVIKAELKDPVEEARARFGLARLLRHMGQGPAALRQIEAGLVLGRRLNDRRLLGQGLTDMGDVLSDLGRNAESLTTFEDALRSARDIKDRRLEASALVGKGITLDRMGRLAEALETFEAGAAAARQTGVAIAEADALRNRGSVLSALGRFDEATASLEASLQIARRKRHRGQEIQSLGDLANVFLYRGRYDEAITRYETCLAMARQIGNRTSEATTRSNMGLVYQNTGRYDEAEASFAAALAIDRAMGSPDGEARALSSLATVALFRGRLDEAKRLNEAALKIRRTIGDSMGEMKSIQNLSLVHRRLGQYGEAVALSQASVDLAGRLGNRMEEAHARTNLGHLLREINRPEEAKRHFEASLEVATTLGVPKDRLLALTGLAGLASDAGRYEEALRHKQVVLELARALGDRWNEEVTLSDIAYLHDRIGRSADALAQYDASLGISRAIGARSTEALTLNDIGWIYLNQRRYADARKCFEGGLAISEPLGDVDRVYRCLWGLARVQSDQQHWPEAVTLYRRAIDQVEQLRTDAKETRLQTEFLAGKIDLYYNLAWTLLNDPANPSGPAEAFAVAERVKARSLVDILQSGKADVCKGMTAQERQRDEQIRARVTALSVQLEDLRAKRVEPERLKAVARQIDDARREFDEFRRQVYLTHSEVQTQQVQFAPDDLTTLNRSLLARTPQSAVLSYLVGKNELLLFVLTRGVIPDGPATVAVHRVKVSGTELYEAVQRFRAACLQPQSGAPNSDDLYRWLIAPAANSLAGVANVVISPDNFLHTLPFQALQDPDGKYLIERHSISYAPSATALVKMCELADRRKKAPGAAPADLLSVGRPAFGGSLPDLPASETEAKAVAALYPGRAKLLVGPTADKAAVLSAIGAARLVHLATHGLLNEANPLYSAIALTPVKGRDDGRLYARDLLDVDLRADLVVLSACETALGQQVKGEGVLGLAWALFVAGAPSSIVAQWSVADESTAALMAEFHARLAAGTTKAEALRQAQIALLQSYDPVKGQIRGVGGTVIDVPARTVGAKLAPFYWAAFTLTGDWR